MTNAFEILGIADRLVVSEDTLRAAFLEAGRLVHPDAGGGYGEFAALREAMVLVSSPSQRLKHWLELRGMKVDTRGSVDSPLMDLFAEVGAVTQRAEALIRQRDDAKSALALALLEREAHACREAVGKALTIVETAITRECTAFPGYESASRPDMEAASRTVRNLAFLEKWRVGLRGVFSRLV